MECIFFPLSPGENEMENNNPKKCNAHTQSARKHTYALWAILKILQQMHSGSNRGCLPFCFIVLKTTKNSLFLTGLLMKFMPIALHGIPHLSYLMNPLNLIE